MGLKNLDRRGKLELALHSLAIIMTIYMIVVKNNYQAAAIIIIALGFLTRNINIFFSIFMLLYLTSSGQFLGETDRLALLYNLISIVIILKGLYRLDYKKILKTLRQVDLKDFPKTIKELYLKEPYFFISLLIVFWGSMSSVFSTQVILSFKKTSSIFMVFLVSYFAPKYLLSGDEKKNHLAYLMFPVSLVLTVVSTLNMLVFLKLIEPAGLIGFWTKSETIYRNSNVYGARLMIALMLMTLFIFFSRDLKEESSSETDFSLGLNIYFLYSFILLIFNLLLSGSRTSLFSVAVALIPLAIKFWKITLSSLAIISYPVYRNKEKYIIFRKLGKGSSGRTDFWDYTLKEIVPKRPILGYGSGSFTDHVGASFEVNHMHSSYLDVLVSNGIVGLGLWILVLVHVIKDVIKLEENRMLFILMFLSLLIFSSFEIGVFYGLEIKTSFFWLLVFLLEGNQGLPINYFRKGQI